MRKLSRRRALELGGAAALLPFTRLLAACGDDGAASSAGGDAGGADGGGGSLATGDAGVATPVVDADAGIDESLVEPAWLTGQPAGTWLEIPGTSGVPGGLNMNAYSDFAVRQRDGHLLVAAAGGHSDGASNAAASLDLLAATPGWKLLRPSTWNGTEVNVDYYADGSPCARHTYHHTHYVESLDAILLAGCRYGWGGGTPTHGGMDLFDLASGAYLPRRTWPDSPSAYGVVLDGAGNVWTQTGHKLDVKTVTWSKPGTGSLLRYPAAYDAARDRIFALQFADGEGYGDAVLHAVELDPTTGNSTTITFAASAALTQFVADAPTYAAMAYCAADGRFYFMHPGRMGTFFVVTPNTTAVWDMTLWTPGGPKPPTSGVLCKRMHWITRLGGFVVQGDQRENLRFVRGTAPR